MISHLDIIVVLYLYIVCFRLLAIKCKDKTTTQCPAFVHRYLFGIRGWFVEGYSQLISPFIDAWLIYSDVDEEPAANPQITVIILLW